MRSITFLTVIALLLLALVDADSKAYKLQRRFGDSAVWSTIADFTIVRNHEHSPARLKISTIETSELTKDQKTKLTNSSFIFYRVAEPEQSEVVWDENMISASTSPCALIRGFEAVDGTTVALHENIKILPGEGTSIVGLQVIADTNFFHSKMRNGDECDLTVVQKLFPTVRISAHVSLLQPTALMSTVRYKDLEDLEAAKAADGPKKAEGPKKSIRKVKNADGEWVEEEIIVEEKSFIQKYWMYLVVPFVLQIVQGLAKK